MIPLPYSWVLSVTPKDTDYMIGSDMIPVTINNAPHADNIIVEANQNRDPRYYYSCVLHACAGCIADFWNLSNEAYLDLIEKSVVEALRTWVFDIHSGMNVSDGVDVVRNIWNAQNPNRQMNSFRIPYADPLLGEILAKGHSITTAYRGNQEWENDVNADGVLNKGFYWPTTFGHSVRLRLSKTNGQIVNSYKGVVPYNIYRAPFLYSLVTNQSNFWDCFYVFLPKEWQDDTTEKLLLGVKLGIWNGDRPDDEATRFECASMIARKMHGRLATASVIIPAIWNGSEPNRVPTHVEFSAMFERAGFVTPRDMTRGEIVRTLVG